MRACVRANVSACVVARAHARGCVQACWEPFQPQRSCSSGSQTQCALPYTHAQMCRACITQTTTTRVHSRTCMHTHRCAYSIHTHTEKVVFAVECQVAVSHLEAAPVRCDGLPSPMCAMPCMCISVWVRTHASKHARTQARTHARTHARTRARTHTRTHTCMGKYVHIHACTHPHMHACMCGYVHVLACACAHLHVSVYAVCA